MITLRPFQKEFIAKALVSRRGHSRALNAKGWTASLFWRRTYLRRCLTPGDPLFEPGKEVVQCAGSIEQARMVFGFIRRELEPTGEYRFIDSSTRIGILHKSTNTRLRVISSSNGKTAMGLVNTSLAVADEPGSWEIQGGALMWDALTGALGKPGSKMRNHCYRNASPGCYREQDIGGGT